MNYPPGKSSPSMGTETSMVENAAAQAGASTNQSPTPGYPAVDSGKTALSIAEKAEAILQDELNIRGTRSAGETGLVPGSDLLDLEPAIEELPRQASELGNTLASGLEHRIEEIPKLASQLPSLGGLISGEAIPGLSFLKPPSNVSPGEIAKVPLTLINDDLKETVECTLNPTDLLGGAGQKILAEQITILPNPVKIPPGKTAEVKIDIHVPNGIPPGNYAGLLQGNDISPLQVLQIAVGEEGTGESTDMTLRASD